MQEKDVVLTIKLITKN